MIFIVMEMVITEHIEITPGICGGKPRIAGHRIRVADVAVWHEDLGMSAAEICTKYAGLTLSDVHAALAYYYDHREEIRGDLESAKRSAEEIRSREPSVLDRKLKELGRSRPFSA